MKTYLGNPCKRGHDGTRYTSSQNCVQCSKDAMTRRYEKSIGGKPKRRASRLAKIEAVASGVDRFNSGVPCERGHLADRYVAGGNCVECMAGRHDRMRGDTNYRAKIQRARTKYAPKFREVYRAWRKRNPEKDRQYGGDKRAARSKATPEWANKQAMREIYRLAVAITGATGVLHHVDHTVPLQSNAVCGLHWEGNLQIIPASENCSKGNRHWPDMS